MKAAGGQAFGVAWLAFAADVGADVVDGTGDPFADIAREGIAAVASTAHARQTIIHECERDAREFLVGFQRESRPFAGVGAAGATRHAIEFGALEFRHGRRSGRGTRADVILRECKARDAIYSAVTAAKAGTQSKGRKFGVEGRETLPSQRCSTQIEAKGGEHPAG